MSMDNFSRRIGDRTRKIIKTGALLGLGMTAIGSANAQSPGQIIGGHLREVSKKMQKVKPRYDLDMSSFPAGTKPIQAFEMRSYQRLDNEGKIQFLKDAIDAEEKNLEQDKEDPNVSQEEIEEQQKKIDDLKNKKRSLSTGESNPNS